MAACDGSLICSEFPDTLNYFVSAGNDAVARLDRGHREVAVLVGAGGRVSTLPLWNELDRCISERLAVEEDDAFDGA
jgi:hypothetical protein